MKLSVKIYGRHSSHSLPKACFSGRSSPEGQGASHHWEGLKPAHPSRRAGLTHRGHLSTPRRYIRITGYFAVNMMPIPKCKRNAQTGCWYHAHLTKKPLLCHSLADCKWLARSSALPYLALLSPALLVEIPGGEWSVSTHFIFYSGATDQRRFVFVGPRRKKFAPQQGKAPAVHRNAYSEALSRG